MASGPRRVVSLLPAATEIVAALGLHEQLVAVSHDCDHPPVIADKPRITRCEIHDAGLPSGAVEAWVRETLAERGSLYTIDEALLRALEPDVILTQKLCDVCAPSYGSVAQLAGSLRDPPEVVNLEPSSLGDIFDNIGTVARVLHLPERGERVVAELRERVRAVRQRSARAGRRPRCVLLEWLDPLYSSGHWGPEIVDLAGGVEVLGRPGEDSTPVTWEDVAAAEPEVLLLACCGNSVGQTLEELPAVVQGKDGWESLPAVASDQVYVLDGSAYVSRPGPRIVDSLELIAGAMHPDLFPEWRPERHPWQRVMRVHTRDQG